MESLTLMSLYCTTVQAIAFLSLSVLGFQTKSLAAVRIGFHLHNLQGRSFHRSSRPSPVLQIPEQRGACHAPSPPESPYSYRQFCFINGQMLKAVYQSTHGATTISTPAAFAWLIASTVMRHHAIVLQLRGESGDNVELAPRIPQEA